MHRVLSVLAALAVVSCAIGESQAALFRRGCSGGGSCGVGSSSCNVSSSQSCNISGVVAPASVIVQPQAPPVLRIPTPQFPTSQFPTQEPAFATPQILTPQNLTPQPTFAIPAQSASIASARPLQYDLSSAAQFCATPVARPAVEAPASAPAWPPAILVQPGDESLAMLRAFR